MSVEFAAPGWLLLLPVPVLVWETARRHHRGGHDHGCALLHSQARVIAAMAGDAARPRRLPTGWLLGCLLLIVALADPRWHDRRTYHPLFGRDLVVAIDVSASMRAQDHLSNGRPVSRLELVTRLSREFIARRHGDRTGLVVFADDAYTLAPLSHDPTTVSRLLDEIQHGLLGDKTALGDALAVAISQFDQPQRSGRAIVVFTDGTNTSGSRHPLAVIPEARDAGVKIYTVGVGTPGETLFPEAVVNPPALTTLPVDFELLRTIATQTGGRFYQASEPDTLANVLATIDTLETGPVDKQGGQQTEMYWLPLILGGLALTVDSLRRRYGMEPAGRP